MMIFKNKLVKSVVLTCAIWIVCSLIMIFEYWYIGGTISASFVAKVASRFLLVAVFSTLVLHVSRRKGRSWFGTRD